MKIIETRQGAFGEIRIIDTPLVRRMVIGDTVQGACCHDPDANAILGNAPPGPGPVIEASYQLAWLLAGLGNPGGKGLMMGLGCGSGAIGLLHHFRKLKLDVIESDPVVVELANRYFPLVRHYQEQQRLRLFIADAYHGLSDIDDGYDIALIDVAFDQRNPVRLDKMAALIASTAPKAAEIWLNIIDRFNSRSFSGVLRTFEKCGMPAAYAWSPVPPTDWLPVRRNWIISTAARTIPGQGFHPYAGLMGRGAESARRLWRVLIGSRTAVDGRPSDSDHGGCRISSEDGAGGWRSV